MYLLHSKRSAAGSNQEGQKVKSHIAQDAKGGIDGIPCLNSSQLEKQDLDTGHQTGTADSDNQRREYSRHGFCKDPDGITVSAVAFLLLGGSVSAAEASVFQKLFINILNLFTYYNLILISRVFRRHNAFQGAHRIILDQIVIIQGQTQTGLAVDCFFDVFFSAYKGQ